MSRSLLLYIPLGLLCLVSFQYRIYDAVPFHPDESTWLASARSFWMVLDGDFSNEYWTRFDAWTQPHVGHYAYAIVLRAAGFSPDRLPKRYEYGKGNEYNFLQGRIPGKDVLLTARRFSAVCAALACLLACEVGRRTFGWSVGLIAALWLAANPLMRHVCQRAMMDAQITLALVAGILLMIFLFRCWQDRRLQTVLLASLATGLFFGLATAIKLNGGVLCLVCLAALPCLGLDVYLRKRRGEFAARAALRKLAAAVVSAAVVCSTALATFYLLNPMLWAPGIREGARMMLDARYHDISRQQIGHPEDALRFPRQRCAAGIDMFFVQWPTFRAAPIEDFVNPIRAGEGRRGLWYVDGPLFIAGIVALVARLLRRAWKDRRIDPTCIVALWLILYSGFIFFTIPLRWTRYYQNYLPVQALMVAVGIVGLVHVIGRIRPSRPAPPSLQSHSPPVQ